MKQKARHILTASVLCTVLFAIQPVWAQESHGNTSKVMVMHHMHMLINHTITMAAEGDNMVMIGTMGMGGDIDQDSIRHGRAMIAEAKQMIDKIVSGEAMHNLHQAGLTAKSKGVMTYTHKLADAAKGYIKELEAMQPVSVDGR